MLLLLFVLLSMSRIIVEKELNKKTPQNQSQTSYIKVVYESSIPSNNQNLPLFQFHNLHYKIIRNLYIKYNIITQTKINTNRLQHQLFMFHHLHKFNLYHIQKMWFQNLIIIPQLIMTHHATFLEQKWLLKKQMIYSIVLKKW